MKYLLLIASLVSLISTVSATEVMDIYSGKWTPCDGNTTYQYNTTVNLNYACIIVKSDGSNILNVNGTMNPMYDGVKSFWYGSSGTLFATLSSNNTYRLIVGNYVSPLYNYEPTLNLWTDDHFTIIYQDAGGYGWSYDGIVYGRKISSSTSTWNTLGGDTLLLESSSSNNYWYDRIFFRGKQVFTGYSHIIYGGEFTKWKTNVVLFLAQKWEKVEVLALKKDGSFSVLSSVTAELTDYPYFVVSSKNYSRFAYTIRIGSSYKVVTEKGISPSDYDTITQLSYFDGFNLFMSYMKVSMNYFSIAQKTYGPYDTLGSLNTNNSGKSWFIYVTHGGKDFININGKEIKF